MNDTDCPKGAFCHNLKALGEKQDTKVCLQPCCESSECGDPSDGAACIPLVNGAGVCLQAAQYGRPMLGMKLTGAAASSPGECRSGWMEDGVCADVCCSDKECGSSDVCVKATVPASVTPEPERIAYVCKKKIGGEAYQKICSGDSECESKACDLTVVWNNVPVPLCSKPCCESEDGCGKLGFGGKPVACRYIGKNGQFIRTCGTVSSGTTKAGEPCTKDSDCRGDFCIAGSPSYCSDACCSDSDCPASMKCRPYAKPGATTPAVFRCVKPLHER